MAWTNTTRKNSGTGSGVGSINVALNSTVAGSLIAVAASWYQGGGALTGVTISDPVNGTYTLSFLQDVNWDGTQHSGVTLHYIKNNVGGDLTITIAWASGGDSTPDLFAAVHEFAGGDTTSPASGTPAKNSGATGNASTTAMTPADNDVLVLAAMNEESGTITENAGSEGFTLSAESESAGQPGSLVWKIISGAPGTPSESWTKGTSNHWAAGIAAFKPAPAAAPYLKQTTYRWRNDDGDLGAP